VSRAKRLVEILQADRSDANERLEALRLQAKAWRILALISIVDPAAGKRHAQWLFFKSVPCVDPAALNEFIEENQERARLAGIESGVFSK
jgi:hypothetical protein